jgi:poly(3-hydroxyalkanoate) synthetase
MFDYQSENARIYGSGIPPEYELSNFKIPVYIYQGENDSIVSPKVKFH